MDNTTPTPTVNHNDDPDEIVDNERVRVVTNKSGIESDTDKFTHENAGQSELLESYQPGFGATNRVVTMFINGAWRRVGYIRTGTDTSGNAGVVQVQSLVKMHLVNSYLHPKANDWARNWFWGSADFNKTHSNEIEEAVKSEHPSNKSSVASLQYETAVGTKRPGSMQKADFENRLIQSITRSIQHAWAEPPNPFNANLLQVGGKDLGTAHTDWVGAVNAIGYAGLTSAWRTKNTAGAWSTVTQKPITDDKVWQIAFVSELSRDDWVAYFPLPSRTRGKSKARSPGVGDTTVKKGKAGE